MHASSHGISTRSAAFQAAEEKLAAFKRAGGGVLGGLAETVGFRLKRQKQELAQAHELYLKGMLNESAEVLRGARRARMDAPTCLPGEIQAVKTHLAAGRLKVALEHAEALKELSKTHCADALKKHESCAEATQIVSEVEEVAELHRSLESLLQSCAFKVR